MDAQDEAVGWVRDRFDDPSYYLDTQVRAHVAHDPAFAVTLKEMITRPPRGLRYRVDVTPPREPEMATPEALEQLNAHLGLVGARAVPFDGDHNAGYERLWTVRVPQSHVDYVTFALTGPYGLSSAPDGDVIVEELTELDVRELEALRRCFQDTIEHLGAGLTRLQGEAIPSPAEMLRFSVEDMVRHIRFNVSRLELIDGIVAREQLRR